MLFVFARKMFLANAKTNLLEGAVPSKVALFTAGKAAYSSTIPTRDFLAVARGFGVTARIASSTTVRSPAILLLFTCSGSIPLLES